MMIAVETGKALIIKPCWYIGVSYEKIAKLWWWSTQFNSVRVEYSADVQRPSHSVGAESQEERRRTDLIRCTTGVEAKSEVCKSFGKHENERSH